MFADSGSSCIQSADKAAPAPESSPIQASRSDQFASAAMDGPGGAISEAVVDFRIALATYIVALAISSPFWL
jgi:hypothetical protein